MLPKVDAMADRLDWVRNKLVAYEMDAVPVIIRKVDIQKTDALLGGAKVAAPRNLKYLPYVLRPDLVLPVVRALGVMKAKGVRAMMDAAVNEYRTAVWKRKVYYYVTCVLPFRGPGPTPRDHGIDQGEYEAACDLFTQLNVVMNLIPVFELYFDLSSGFGRHASSSVVCMICHDRVVRGDMTWRCDVCTGTVCHARCFGKWRSTVPKCLTCRGLSPAHFAPFELAEEAHKNIMTTASERDNVHHSPIDRTKPLLDQLVQ